MWNGLKAGCASFFDGDGQLAIDELWNENQLAQALRRTLPCSCHRHDRSKGTGGSHTGESGWHRKPRLSGGVMMKTLP